MVNKRTLLLFFIFISVVVALFFSIKQHKNSNAAEEKEPITVLLDWYISEDQAPILLAQINGYFAQHQLQVKLIELSDASEGPKLLVRQQADLAISYGGSYLSRLEKMLPIKQVGTLIDHPLNCLVYLPSSGIHEPRDLKNKRLGYSDPNDDFTLLKTVLKSGHVSINDVTLINIQNTLIQPLLLGKIDVAIDMMRNIEPVVIQQHGVTPAMFCPEDFDVSNYSELIYIAPQGQTSKKITLFLQAVTEATAYIKQHPEEAWEKLKAAYPKFNTELHHAIWQKTYPFFAPSPEMV